MNMRYFLKCGRTIRLPNRQPFWNVDTTYSTSHSPHRLGKRRGRVFIKVIDLFEMTFGNDQDVPLVALTKIQER